jgi:predicted DNA-binding ribbon-helix-helix protein
LLASSPVLKKDPSKSIGLSKHQTGLRLDRILFKQFQDICQREKLQPGEAVESLLRLVVEAGSITGVSVEAANNGNSVRMFNDALFKSRLARIKTSLELEEKYWKETGREVEEKESEFYVQEITELGRRNVSQDLVKEFETILTSADKQYQQTQTKYFEEEIDDRKT